MSSGVDFFQPLLPLTRSVHGTDLSPSSGRPSLDRAISMAIDEEEAVTRGDLLQEFDRELARITEFYRKQVRARAGCIADGSRTGVKKAR